MDARSVVIVVLVAAMGEGARSARCPPPCPVCPDVAPCPVPSCPVPKCPPLPDIPACPVPRCPSLPEIPACPPPVLDLSCPNVTCPPQSCPPCPACPASPSCPPCASNASNASNDTAPSNVPPPIGYERVPGQGTYKFYSISRTFFAANRTCSQDGAYLAIPDNMEELKTITGITTRHRKYLVHVGFVNSGTGFATVLGQPLTTEQTRLWFPGEPDNTRIPNCAYASTRTTSGMSDQSCGDWEYFICELSN